MSNEPQDVHRLLAFRLLGALRTIQLHGVKNAAAVFAVERLRAALELLFPSSGGALLFQFVDDVLVVGQRRVTTRLKDEQDVAPLRELLAQRGVGGLRFRRVPEAAELCEWLAAICRPMDQEGARAVLAALGDLGIDALEPKTLAVEQERTTVEVSSMSFALQTYARAIVGFREAVRALSAGRDPLGGRIQVTRVVRDLVAIAEARPQHLAELVQRYRAEPGRLAEGYAEVHAANTCVYSVLIGRLFGLDRVSLLDLGTSALLADAGFAMLPASLTEGTAPLAPEERRSLERFMRRAAQAMLARPPLDEAALRRVVVAYEHHSPFAASKGTRGATTLLSSRIVAVADAFDALSSHRPWRTPFSEADVLASLKREAGTRFDPLVVAGIEALVRAFKERQPAAVA